MRRSSSPTSASPASSTPPVATHTTVIRRAASFSDGDHSGGAMGGLVDVGVAMCQPPAGVTVSEETIAVW